MKSFGGGLSVLLTVAMLAVATVAWAAGSSTDLKDFITAVDVTGGTLNQDGSITVKPGTELTLGLSFEETSGLQFDNGSLTYDLPSGFDFAAQSGTFPMSITDGGGTTTMNVPYAISDGRLTVTWPTDDPTAYQKLVDAANAKFNISIKGTVTDANGDVHFGGDVTKKFNLDDSHDVSIAKYILQVVGDTEVTAKDTTTTSKKEVKDTNDTTGVTSDWQNTADYDIGDAVPFKLTGTVASDYADYPAPYYFAFHDKYVKTQLGDPQNVVVKIDGNVVDPSKYTLNVTSDGFDVVFNDLKQTAAQAGSTVTVEYTSELLAGANVGSAGNVNTSNIEFSNDSNNDQHRGKTPDDTVIIFTYKVVVNKANETGQPLAGAEFTLTKAMQDGSTKTIAVTTAQAGTQFNFTGLDDGEYTLTETKTPAGYNTIDPIKFTVTSVKDDAGKKLVSINGIAATGEIDLGTATQKAQVDKDAGSITTTVVNRSGSTLPSTGGMGTTVLYGLGALLVVGAGVGLYVSHRKGHDGVDPSAS